MTHQIDPLGVLATSTEGRVERPVMTPRWPVATNIQLVGEDRLQWHIGESEERWVDPSPGLLEDFVNLRDGSSEAILAYARRWGMLRLCEHDFPAGHPSEYWPTQPIIAHPCPYDEQGRRLTPEALKWDRYAERMDRYEEQLIAHFKQHGETKEFEQEPPTSPPLAKNIPRADFHYCSERGYRDDAPWEPIEAWRTWAARAYALLSITATLREERAWSENDWRVAVGSETWKNPTTSEECWRDVEYFANLWLGAARVRPWLVPGNGAVQLGLGSGRGNSPLFGALAIQLALAVCGAEGFAVCDGCKRLYAPTRKPRAGDRGYCRGCRKVGVPQRHASRAYRARRTSARTRSS